jgi:hypothetical protein
MHRTPITRKHYQRVEPLIVADLQEGKMRYVDIATKHGVGLNKVNDLAKANGLLRYNTHAYRAYKAKQNELEETV